MRNIFELMRDTRKNILTLFKSINRSTIAVLVFALTYTSCMPADEWSPYKSNAEINATIVSSVASTISGTTIGDPTYTWTLSVVEGGAFCSAITKAGFVGDEFLLRFSANETDKERVAKAKIVYSDGFTKTFTIRQLIPTKNPDYDHTWAEQPEYKEGTSLIHKTYYTTLSDGRRVRNFSICYDTDKICSRWVAYPAHSVYTTGRSYQVGGSTQGRTNAWAFDDAVTQYKESSNWSAAYEIVSTYDLKLDTYNTYTNPIIPQSKQANIVGSNGFGYGYARGHMLPSADRYNTWNTNAQTCYATNIMVQNYDFNSASWGNLENKVRGKICSDTLYVVVGTLFENSTKINKNGRNISVPSHCFKLLLRTKKGSTRQHISDIKSADELMCIGFLFENNNGSKGGKVELIDAAISVAEIERRSGFLFFRNLDPSVADKVKAQCNFSDWNF